MHLTSSPHTSSLWVLNAHMFYDFLESTKIRMFQYILYYYNKCNQLTCNNIWTATSVEATGYGDSRQCLKESSPTLLAPDVAITGNHLDVPRPGDNPNLLSPESLSQRRGMICTTRPLLKDIVALYIF